MKPSQFFIVVLGLLLSSCYYNSRLVYLQNKAFNNAAATSVDNNGNAYRLQPSDVVSVQVKSAADANISNLFNVNTQPAGMFVSPGNLYLEGYTINSMGNIILPVIGEVGIKDLTIEEAQKLIQSRVDKYLTQATAIVKLTSFKVTVLGEVKNPGYYYVYNNQATILEGLGMAGDLTDFGNRSNIKLIRQRDGVSKVILVDITDADLLKSEYFFLMPGDVLYVEPLRARSRRTNLDLLSVVFAGLTTGVLVLSYLNTTQQN